MDSFRDLSTEISSFCDFVSPTPAERSNRQAVIDEIRGIIADIWPNARVDVFGSQMTGLYLPESDIDMVVFGARAPPNHRLNRLASEFRKRQLVSDLEVIGKAKVPIVKFTHSASGIHVDVCFEVANGLHSGRIMKQFLQKMAPLRSLVLVLKYFLTQRALNETYTGGVGSFLLQMMLVSMLQHHKRRRQHQHRSSDQQPEASLGMLLYEFFDLYGRSFNYATTGISVKDGGTYFRKAQRGWCNEQRPMSLAVENPLEPDIDVGRNAFEIMRVRQAFCFAAQQIDAMIQRREMGGASSSGSSGSILNTIIWTDIVLAQRRSTHGSERDRSALTGDNVSEADSWAHEHFEGSSSDEGGEGGEGGRREGEGGRREGEEHFYDSDEDSIFVMSKKGKGKEKGLGKGKSKSKKKGLGKGMGKGMSNWNLADDLEKGMGNEGMGNFSDDDLEFSRNNPRWMVEERRARQARQWVQDEEAVNAAQEARGQAKERKKNKKKERQDSRKRNKTRKEQRQQLGTGRPKKAKQKASTNPHPKVKTKVNAKVNAATARAIAKVSPSRVALSAKSKGKKPKQQMAQQVTYIKPKSGSKLKSGSKGKSSSKQQSKQAASPKFSGNDKKSKKKGKKHHHPQ
jgi:predicted nucleotidyltransferase